MTGTMEDGGMCDVDDQPNATPLIVVLDDDRAIVEGLSLLLDSWGFEVVTALSLAALEQSLSTLTRPPSLIIADHYLPAGRTGAEAVERLRGFAGKPVPAIILTGDTTPERQEEAQALGCMLLHKPVQVAPLRAAVELLTRG
ncbi:response regulator [Azospirillum doebereinerae]|uniref:response regulator n=1 Tax=Azospirillum doebereinerae TaxID=92933 RepID=UPI001EE59606|nr:response regulator [Azospirillum doebereinerae]MCG5242243.1 response regulator [Azospirillum doebereinerae]